MVLYISLELSNSIKKNNFEFSKESIDKLLVRGDKITLEIERQKANINNYSISDSFGTDGFMPKY